VALLTAGKLLLEVHLPYLLGLLRNLSLRCPKLSEAAQEKRQPAAGMC
jgi:hypothetical protein